MYREYVGSLVTWLLGFIYYALTMARVEEWIPMDPLRGPLRRVPIFTPTLSHP